MKKKSSFPRRWQDCSPFVNALTKREYNNVLSDGLYLYLYELWQDGVKYGEAI
jgi:hypothetical protein